MTTHKEEWNKKLREGILSAVLIGKTGTVNWEAMTSFIEKTLAADRARIAEQVKEIPELNVGDWTKHAVKTIGLERLGKQDAANEGWNNCRKLILELLQTP